MAAAVGIWLGLSGAIAVLVGLTGLRRVRRLRRGGTRTWAEAAPVPGNPHLMVLRYTLPDERVLEGVFFVAAGVVTGILGP